jgi:hypothetical protein
MGMVYERTITSTQSTKGEGCNFNTQRHICAYSIIKQRGFGLYQVSRESNNEEQKWYGNTDWNLFVSNRLILIVLIMTYKPTVI